MRDRPPDASADHRLPIAGYAPPRLLAGAGTIGRAANATVPAFEGAVMTALAAQTPARDRASEG